MKFAIFQGDIKVRCEFTANQTDASRALHVDAIPNFGRRRAELPESATICRAIAAVVDRLIVIAEDGGLIRTENLEKKLHNSPRERERECYSIHRGTELQIR